MAGTEEGVREVERFVEALRGFLGNLSIPRNSGTNPTAGQTGTTGPAKVDFVEEQEGNPFPRPSAAPSSCGFWDTRQSTQGGVEETLARLTVEERRKSPSSWKHEYLSEVERSYTLAVAAGSYLFDVGRHFVEIASRETCPEDVKKDITKGVNSLEAVLERLFEAHGRLHLTVQSLNGSPGTEGLVEYLADRELVDKTSFGVISARLKDDVATHLKKRREAIIAAERKLESTSFVTQRSKGKGRRGQQPKGGPKASQGQKESVGP